MGRNEVVAHYSPWKGDRQVAAEEATVIVIGQYEVNGLLCNDNVMRLEMDGPFLIGVLEPETLESQRALGIEEELVLSNREFQEKMIARVRQDLDSDYILDDSTEECVRFLIGKLELRERGIRPYITDEPVMLRISRDEEMP